jgi:RND family efflux transporter MFP subunit
MRIMFLSLALAATLASGAQNRRVEIAVEIQALRDVRVPAEVSGRVLTRPDNESAVVKAGEVVVTIDSVLLQAGARAARALEARAKARREWARIELERVVALVGKGTVGRAELDQAQVAAREAEATLLAAAAQVVEVETRLDRARIVAPFDGKLVRVYPQAGEYMRVGETAFRIIDDSSLKIIVYVAARLLPRMQPGVALRIETDVKGLELPVLHAQIFSVAAAAEGRARTFRVEARVRDKSGKWRPGMTGRLVLEG